jgi:peroxiredoxin
MAMTPTFLIQIDSARLGRCVVKDETGKEVRLGGSWTEKPAILVFLRHFACIACRAHAAQVWHEREKYEQNGAKIVFVGNGSPDYIQKFKVDLGINDAVIVTDPTLRSFWIAGFKRGFLASLGPTSIKNGIGLFAKGHSQKMPSKASGDLWQLGGVIVVRADGRVTYQYISQATGDFPPEKDIVTMVSPGKVVAPSDNQAPSASGPTHAAPTSAAVAGAASTVADSKAIKS